MTTFAFSPLSTEERKALRQNWARLHKTWTASDYILRAFLLGTPLSKHFSPITNGNKLANGYEPFSGAYSAARPLCTSLSRNPRLMERYATLLGIALEDVTQPEHVQRLDALVAFCKTITRAKLPEEAL